MKEKLYAARRVPMELNDWLALGWERDEAVRFMTEEKPQLRVLVTVTMPDTDGTLKVYELPHYQFHSDGPEFGYGGSGPSDLARCILIDFYGVKPVRTTNTKFYDDTNPRLPVSYQAFKRDFVAVAPQKGFQVTGDEILKWAATQ